MCGFKALLSCIRDTAVLETHANALMRTLICGQDRMGARGGHRAIALRVRIIHCRKGNTV